MRRRSITSTVPALFETATSAPQPECIRTPMAARFMSEVSGLSLIHISHSGGDAMKPGFRSAGLPRAESKGVSPALCAFEAGRYYETGPTRTIGPVGCGMPPSGSSVIANAFASTPGGSFTIQGFIGPLEYSTRPALMGLPSIGTSHNW